MKRATRFNVIACLVCAVVAAFIAAHDVPPEERVGAALLGVLGLAVLTALVVWVLRRFERANRP